MSEEKEIILTRYLDLNKFVTLLSRGIFIPRIDMFEDKIEGIIPYPDANSVDFTIYDNHEIKSLMDDLLKTKSKEEVFYFLNLHIQYFLNQYQYIKENPFCCFEELDRTALFINMQLGDRKNFNKDLIISELRNIFFILFQETFKSTLVSCWYLGSEESLPMWDIYTQTKGVAIQTTAKKFKNVVKLNGLKCEASAVEYPENFEKEYDLWKQKDYFEENISKFYNKKAPSYPHYWFFRKRPCFKHENEYRFIIEYDSILQSLLSNNDKNSAKAKGCILKIKNLNIFIDKIIIAPKARTEFELLIKSLAQDYKIDVSKVITSGIKNLNL